MSQIRYENCAEEIRTNRLLGHDISEIQYIDTKMNLFPKKKEKARLKAAVICHKMRLEIFL